MMTTGSVKWSSPSNIAIVKYWGKYGNQMPRNTSISLTLKECKSITSLEWTPKSSKDDALEIDFYLEGKKDERFASKTMTFLKENRYMLPFLKDYKIIISTENTFPHSAGIASSASGMSALSLCLLDMAQNTGRPLEIGGSSFTQNASILARLGSGSACRSLFEGAAIWGHHPEIAGSSDQYAIGMGDMLSPVFSKFYDSIVIVSSEEKSVSSTAGHALMTNNPFSDLRYSLAQKNALKALKALQFGDLLSFGEVLEAEALMLHALMMTSQPSYILIKPGTLRVIEAVRNFRNATSLPIYFTLDAGPNVHILYPDTCKKQVDDFFKSELSDCEVIHDMVGEGPQKLI